MIELSDSFFSAMIDIFSTWWPDLIHRLVKPVSNLIPGMTKHFFAVFFSGLGQPVDKFFGTVGSLVEGLFGRFTQFGFFLGSIVFDAFANRFPGAVCPIMPKNGTHMLNAAAGRQQSLEPSFAREYP